MQTPTIGMFCPTDGMEGEELTLKGLRLTSNSPCELAATIGIDIEDSINFHKFAPSC
ncbi:MAG: hypothetical protein R2788_13370 [Saprospiraceae bacterium]